MTTQTPDPLTTPIQSTNVRTCASAPIWLRASFSAAGYLAPSLTAAVAERLFFRTSRRGPRPGERDVLEAAIPSSIAGMKDWAMGRPCFWCTAGDEVRAQLKERVERQIGVSIESIRGDLIAPSMRMPLLVIHDRHQRILRAEPVTNVAVSFIDAAKHQNAAA